MEYEQKNTDLSVSENAQTGEDNDMSADTKAPIVIIYSTPTCHFCHAAKEFFTENNVAFEDYNVQDDTEKRTEMIERSGQMGVPVIFIGEEMVVGFDEPKIRTLLGL
jgi:glutaredoxin-like YruB-family protein